MNSGSCHWQVSLLYATGFPIPLSPTTCQSSNVALSRYPSARRISLSGSRSRHSLAGSPKLTGRIEFVFLRMDRSPPAAPHLASRRRSCSRLQAGERLPGEDFHLPNQCARRRTSAAACRRVAASRRNAPSFQSAGVVPVDSWYAHVSCQIDIAMSSWL